MVDLVTVGETMAVVRGDDVGRLRAGGAARLSLAGAEATVAIGVCRLGHTATWIGRVGDDEFGTMIVAALRGEGVDVSRVARDVTRPTGLMVRHRRTADRTVVAYYRDGLAGSRLDAAMVPAAAIGAARVLYLSGITPALGEAAAATVDHAVRLAREAGVTIAFDVNYRSRLWPPERAAPALARLVGAADLVFAGTAEAALVLGSPVLGSPVLGSPVLGSSSRRAAPKETVVPDGLDVEQERAVADAIAWGQGLRALGAGEAVIKLGRAGAVTVDADGAWTGPALSVTEVDPVGAGDAFVAGYLSSWLDGEPARERLARGAACGAFCVSTTGDWEGLPMRAELALPGGGDVVR